MRGISSIAGQRPPAEILDPEGPGCATVRDFLAIEADALLTFRGFRHVRPLRWVRDRGAVRDVFRFYSLKGSGIAPAWGLDLAIAPLLVGRSLRPKTSLRDLHGDLIIDPLDLPGPRRTLSARGFLGYGLATGRVTGFAARSVAAAFGTFGAAGSMREVRAIYEARNRLEYERFGPAFYTQNHLGWALTCFATGDETAGRRLLHGFCARHGVAMDDMVLLDAVASARAEHTAV